jgi:UDP-glucose:(heptosyl)LPS alpha-1,3-glucosyltransferase
MSLPLDRPVLIVTAGAERGGPDVSIRECAAELAARGVRVAVACPTPPAEGLPGVEHVPLGTNRSPRERSAAFLREADSLIAGYRKTHVVHGMVPARGVHLYTPKSGIFAILDKKLAQSCETRFERTMHRLARRWDATRRRMVDRQREIIADPAGPIVIATSAMMSTGMSELYGDLGRRVRIIPNGVDARRLLAPEDGRERSREALNLAAEDVAFVSVANKFRRKGVFELLRALAKLDERKEGRTPPRFKAFIAGEDEAHGVEKRIKELGLWGRVAVLGSVNTVAALYSAADVLVHPTFYDPSGRAVLEALSVGLPVIASRADGASEFIQGTEAGRLLDDPTDIEAFAWALERFCHPEERSRARAAIASHGLPRKVSIARHVDDLLEVYAEATRPPAPGTGPNKTPSSRLRVQEARPLQRTGGPFTE